MNFRPLLLSALLAPLPVRITLQSGQTFSAQLLDRTDSQITYLRKAPDGSTVRGQAQKAQLQALRLPLPLELQALSTQRFSRTRPLSRQKALEKGKAIYDLHRWHQSWPGHQPLPVLPYARLLLNCRRPGQALPLLKSLPRDPETLFLQALCLHQTSPDDPGLPALLASLRAEDLPPASRPLLRYLLARHQEGTRPDLALLNYLRIPLLHPEERELGPAALLAATALSIRGGDAPTACRLTALLTNDYPEVRARRHRLLALRWLALSNTYTRTHILNRLTLELLP